MPDEVYLNRELAWLDFSARVLSLAEDLALPLLERARFLAIFSRHLDEFFMVRVAGLADQEAAGLAGTSPDGLTPRAQLDAIHQRVLELVARQTRLFTHDIVPALARTGIRLAEWEGLDEDDRAYLATIFEDSVFPILTPLALDPGHPFPSISNLSLNLAVIVDDPYRLTRRFAWVKVPPLLPRFVVMPDGERFVPLEQIIAAHLRVLFPGMNVESNHPFRVTRNADISIEDQEADDLLVAVEMELRRRRFGQAVRLEVDASMEPELRDLLLRKLDLAPDRLYAIDGPLDLSGLWSVHDLDRPDLKYEPYLPVVPPALRGVEEGLTDIFAVLRKQDVLVHHPYETFAGSVEAFVREAADDPRVLAIKQTLYRTSGDSPIVKTLIRAAEQGKQVVVLVELQARFDEAANIAWARALERAGAHVVYGVMGLKTHGKAVLVMRQEADGIQRYCHVGTGNYNPATAAAYEDLGLLSADADLGADLAELFNYLTGYSRRADYRALLLAPLGLRGHVVDMIAHEARPGGRIIMKVNSLVDPEVIEALYAASRAGAQVDLLVRGSAACALACPACLNASASARSWAAIWNTPVYSPSVTARRALLGTTSVQRT